MITGRGRFNLYLLLALATVVAGGCRTHKHDKTKELATLRIHLESGVDDDASRTQKVPIYRASPVDLTVDKEPFLTEAHVASAKVVDVLGGFDLQIQLNRQGSWLFQEYSASNSGKHYAIFSQFGEKGKQSRWLGAPIFSRVMSAGIIQFTPDASREEAEDIARGLNNIAKKNESNDKW
jgi:preprotein translocase subunit SecD